MEEILASIRRIIADDELVPAPQRPAEQAHRAPPADRRRPEPAAPGYDAARPPRRPEVPPRDGRGAAPGRPSAGARPAAPEARPRLRHDMDDVDARFAPERREAYHDPYEAAPRPAREPGRRPDGPADPLRFEHRAEAPARPAPGPERRPQPQAPAPPPPLRFNGHAERFDEAPVHRPAPVPERRPEVEPAAADPRPMRPPAAESGTPRGADAIYAGVATALRVAPEPSRPSAGDPAQAEGARRRDLLSPNSDAAVSAAFRSLGDLALPHQGRTVEDLVKEILRPMLKDWLDSHLPGIVEQLVRAEIERVVRRPR